jgi:uncharacterized protein
VAANGANQGILPTPEGEMAIGENRRIQVLTIDGGGIRGIIPAVILAEIEARVNRPLWQVFDLIAGTSTGGIIAAAIGAGAKGGDAYRPGELVDLYVANGPEIFHRRFLTSVLQLFGPKYSAKGLERVLQIFFGESMLSSAKTPLLISSYDVDHQMPFFFKSQKTNDPAYNWKLREVARATSAAPSYFPAIRLNNGRAAYTLVDGGVCVNNPSVAAFAEARRIYPDANDILVVSVGTGDRNDGLTYSQVRRWGLLGWGKHLPAVFMDSVSETSDYEMHYLLGAGRNYRLQPELVKASPDMDCVSEENLQALKEEASAFLRQQKIAARMDEMCTQLSQPRPAHAAVGAGGTSAEG